MSGSRETRVIRGAAIVRSASSLRCPRRLACGLHYRLRSFFFLEVVRMADVSLRSARALVFPVLGVLLACSNDGGANAGQHSPGDQPGGVALGLGDIAVAPSDEFVLFQRDDRLGVGSTATGDVTSLPVES